MGPQRIKVAVGTIIGSQLGVSEAKGVGGACSIPIRHGNGALVSQWASLAYEAYFMKMGPLNSGHNRPVLFHLAGQFKKAHLRLRKKGVKGLSFIFEAYAFGVGWPRVSCDEVWPKLGSL